MIRRAASATATATATASASASASASATASASASATASASASASATVAALLLAGCAASTPPPAAPGEPPLTAAAIQQIVAEVQAIRGLPARRPITIEQLDESRFAEAIDVRQAPPSLEGIDRMQAALSFAGGGDRAALRSQRILHEQLLGFYEQGSDKVYLRGKAAAGSADMRLLTLAHEIQHALQDQHFGSLGLRTLLDEDARLARLALLEGDATVTGVAYLAAKAETPIRRAVVRLARATRLTPTDKMISDSGPELAGAPAIERERLAFPYIAGTGFAAELHRAGGFPLLDQAFRDPPDTTEQVLHPERYIAGEQAIPVRAPMPPAGWGALAAGRMGELQTRALLLPCVGWERAARAAEGWGGDAFTVLASISVPGAPGPGPSTRAALWSTAWDTEADAIEFEQALSASAACMPALAEEGPAEAESRPTSERAPAAAGVPARLVRKGTHVALALGLPQDRLDEAAAALLALPEPPLPAASPVGGGQVQILPLPPALRPTPGALRGSHYWSAWMGVEALVPPGFSATVGKEGAELALDRSGALGLLAISDRAVNERSTERLFAEVAQGFSSGSELPMQSLGPTTWTTLPLGQAAVHRWLVVGTPVQTAAFVVPVCNGTGAYVIMTAWGTPDDKAAIDAWLLSLRPTMPAPPICAELDPR